LQSISIATVALQALVQAARERPPDSMSKAGLYILCFLICASFTAKKAQDGFTQMVNDEISHSVPVIYANELREWIAGKNNFLLLDSRGYDEYKVSHIRNSKWVGYEHFNRFTMREENKMIPIVVYCSIGYRSEKVGEKLKSYGFKNVFNLWGGIFDWVNKGLPVVDLNNKETKAIHPYSEKWGKWLIAGEKKYE
jgi:rhodanese-related sulfurtransferase